MTDLGADCANWTGSCSHLTPWESSATARSAAAVNRLGMRSEVARLTNAGAMLTSLNGWQWTGVAGDEIRSEGQSGLDWLLDGRLPSIAFCVCWPVYSTRRPVVAREAERQLLPSAAARDADSLRFARSRFPFLPRKGAFASMRLEKSGRGVDAELRPSLLPARVPAPAGTYLLACHRRPSSSLASHVSCGPLCPTCRACPWSLEKLPVKSKNLVHFFSPSSSQQCQWHSY